LKSGRDGSRKSNKDLRKSIIGGRRETRRKHRNLILRDKISMKPRAKERILKLMTKTEFISNF
jgi:hypothetical protein